MGCCLTHKLLNEAKRILKTHSVDLKNNNNNRERGGLKTVGGGALGGEEGSHMAIQSAAELQIPSQICSELTSGNEPQFTQKL